METLKSIDPAYWLLIGIVLCLSVAGVVKVVRKWRIKTSILWLGIISLLTGPALTGFGGSSGKDSDIPPWGGACIGGGLGLIIIAIICVAISCNYKTWDDS